MSKKLPELLVSYMPLAPSIVQGGGGPQQQRRYATPPALARYRITAHFSIGHKSEPCARLPLQPACAAAALQPAAARKPGGRLPTRRHMSAEQTDPVLEVERLENAIAASTEPDEQKELAEKLGMSRMSAEMSVLSANAAFYDAFQSCDVAKMKAVWSDSDDVTCAPGPPADFGRGPRPELVARALLERRRHAEA